MSLFDSIFKSFIPGRTTVSRETEEKIREDWAKVRQLMKLKGPSNLRQALITADRALDSALKDIFPGESMGERLKAAGDRFDRQVYNKIWEAHKIRNSLVHETGYEPPYYVINQAVEDLKNAISFLGVSL